ncbi:MAG: hypothetical protein HC881_03265 [Leptolyngbyaceae cyanobacterium SL_7_1]|nr:hypothetical protein [Leptolyngbyaceae cyanobacterium SL_7_1]
MAIPSLAFPSLAQRFRSIGHDRASPTIAPGSFSSGIGAVYTAGLDAVGLDAVGLDDSIV